MRRDYDIFISEANEVRELLESGRVESAWGNALRQMPDVDTFRLDRWECRRDHDHGAMHEEPDYWKAHAPLGDALERAAFAALTTARSTIRKLDVKHISSEAFDWADDGRLDDLDLSELRMLLFCPISLKAERYPGYDKGERERGFAMRIGIVLTEILKRSPKLERLEHMAGGWDTSITFPLDDPVALPYLESFRTDALLRLADCARFISRCSKLKSVEPDSCCNRMYSGAWRDIWRAIRYHPSRMRLKTQELQCHDCFKLSFVGHAGIVEAQKVDPDGDVVGNIEASLANYLANKGRWDASCRLWFGELDAEVGAVSEEDDME